MQTQPQPQNSFPTHLALIGVAVLVAIGVIGRLVPHWPNFTPVVAIAVFAAYVFRGSALAWIVPVAVMALSNAIIGGYEWGVMAGVYAALLLAVAIGRFAFREGAGLFSVGAASLVSALVFFLVTNFAVWAFGAHGTTYPMTPTGLLACYTAALPFFKYLLAGTAFWAAVLFGGHALAGRFIARHRAAAS